jgi:hypothetical protein
LMLAPLRHPRKYAVAFFYESGCFSFFYVDTFFFFCCVLNVLTG